MAKALLSVHVLMAIVFVGPVAGAVVLFPRYARQATLGRGNPGRVVFTVGLLHTISRVGAVHALSVPAFGLATASVLGALGDPWVQGSIGLTVCAAAVLAASVVPTQHLAVAALAQGRDPTRRPAWMGRLTVATVVFTVLWVTIVILMIVRPGSTTGV